MKKRVRQVLVSMMLIAALVLTGVSPSQSAKVAQAAKKASISLNKKSVKVKRGSKVTLKVKAKNAKVKSKKFSSSDKTIASVTKKGVVTGKFEGKATIKCVVKYTQKGSKKVKSKTLKCTVTVYDTLYPVKKVEKEAAYKTSSEDGTTHNEADPVMGFANKSNVTLQMKYNDKTNISSKSVTFKPAGGTKTITKKDNGTMRRDLSAQYLQQYEMGTGVNLGNTMESTYDIGTKLDVIKGKDETMYDKAWGTAEVTEQYFKEIHSYGINTVRIPVAWSNGDKDDGTYTIDPKLLARVEQITNWALNEGMYVIINDHWDNQWWGGFGACKRDASGKKVADTERRKNTWKRYERYWTQIANRFKNYSDHVILESANEELGSRLNDQISVYTGYCKAKPAEIEKWSGGKIKGDSSCGGNLTDLETYQTTNKINQKFVDVIRKTGGNNAYRHLLIAGIDTNIVSTCSEKFSYKEDKDGDGKKEEYTIDNPFKMPKDLTCNGKNRLFLSLHYYTPWNFCGDDGTGEYTYKDQANLKNEFSPMSKFVDQGYAVILGECGVCSPMTVTGSVSKWFEDTFAMARQYHVVPVLWEKSSLFDRHTGALKFKDIADFWNATNVNADGVFASGDASMNLYTGKIDPSKVVTAVPSGTPTWSWEGIWYKNGGDSAVGPNRYSANPTTGVKPEDFVPSSKVTPTIAGDATEVKFDPTGYQMFIKLDYAKYKNPAIVVKFADETLDPANFKKPDEDNVGHIQLGCWSDATFIDTLDINYADFADKAIILKEGGITLNAGTPWLTMAFSSRPTITGVYIYDLGE